MAGLAEIPKVESTYNACLTLLVTARPARMTGRGYLEGYLTALYVLSSQLITGCLAIITEEFYSNGHQFVAKLALVTGYSKGRRVDRLVTGCILADKSRLDERIELVTGNLKIKGHEDEQIQTQPRYIQIYLSSYVHECSVTSLLL